MYAVVLAIGMAQSGLSTPIVVPVLAIMELLTIASALPLLWLFVARHACVATAQRIWTTLALCSCAMLAFATMGVHLVELTAGRAAGKYGMVWPSVMYAIELFASDFLPGLALLFAAGALPTQHTSNRLRHWLRITGALCLASLIGPPVSNMRLQLVRVFGYAVLLPVVA